MKMIKAGRALVLGFLVLPLFFLSGGFVLAADPHLFLSHASGSYSAAFSIEAKVDTGGQNIGGVDIYLEYPKNLLKIESVDKGTALPQVYSLIKNDEGKLRINAYFPLTQAGESYSGTAGLVATINFTPLGTGTAQVKFICTQSDPPETTDSNIIEKTQVKDIIVCSANINGSYTLTRAVGTPTPTPTRAPGATNTPTPTGTVSTTTNTPTPSIPVTGSSAQTVSLIILGFLMLLTGSVLVFRIERNG